MSEQESFLQPCESGAALGCEEWGVLKTLPESELPGSTLEYIVQCPPCWHASRFAYLRKMRWARS